MIADACECDFGRTCSASPLRRVIAEIFFSLRVWDPEAMLEVERTALRSVLPSEFPDFDFLEMGI